MYVVNVQKLLRVRVTLLNMKKHTIRQSFYEGIKPYEGKSSLMHQRTQTGEKPECNKHRKTFMRNPPSLKSENAYKRENF